MNTAAMNMTAKYLRRWADRCAKDALRFRADEDRDRMLRMRDALLTLAANEEWLNPAQKEANGHTVDSGGLLH